MRIGLDLLTSKILFFGREGGVTFFFLLVALFQFVIMECAVIYGLHFFFIFNLIGTYVLPRLLKQTFEHLRIYLVFQIIGMHSIFLLFSSNISYYSYPFVSYIIA